MTSIGGVHRQPSLPGTMTATIRKSVIAAARKQGPSGLAGLMTRFTPRTVAGSGSRALAAGRIGLSYPEPRAGAMSPSRRAVRMAGLQDRLSVTASRGENVRNDRQMASTSFQNFDQKANQLMNLLSSVMKAMNEMRMGTVRNML